MHVAVEAIGIKQGGGILVLNGIVDALIDDPRFTRVTVFSSPQKHFDAPRSEGDGVIWRSMTLEDASYAGRLAWLERGLAHASNRLGADVVLCLNGVGFADVPQVNYVQQALFFDSDARGLFGWSQRTKYATLAMLCKRSCRNAKTVIVQTRWMQKQLSATWQLNAKVAPPPPPKSRGPKTPEKKVLWVGNDLAYKNRLDAEQAQHRLADRGIGLVFATTGPDAIRRDALADMMQSSIALAVTSLAESYSFPLVEAMAWSCPIVCVDRPYARDVCDDAAMFYQRNDSDELASRLLELYVDDSLRRSLVSRGQTRADALRELQGYRIVCDALAGVVR